MKTVIVYYSYSGNNELLAKELQNRLNCDIVKINEVKKRNGLTILIDIFFNRNPKVVRPKVLFSQYDRVILLAPIWAGRIANPMRSFIKLEKENLKEYSFITLCGEGGNKNILAELTRYAGKPPVSVLELKVSDLLKSKNQRKFTSAYKLNEEDIKFFSESIEHYLNSESSEELIYTV